jgi:hypothetical protein
MALAALRFSDCSAAHARTTIEAAKAESATQRCESGLKHLPTVRAAAPSSVSALASLRFVDEECHFCPPAHPSVLSCDKLTALHGPSIDVGVASVAGGSVALSRFNTGNEAPNAFVGGPGVTHPQRIVRVPIRLPRSASARRDM